MTIDQVSGAEVPAPEIAVSSAMTDAGQLAGRGLLTPNDVDRIFRAMRRVEMAEAAAADWGEYCPHERDEKDFAIEHAGYLADAVEKLLRVDRWDAEEWRGLNALVNEFRKRASRAATPPPGYRNASEDEPERNAGPRCVHGALLLIGPLCQACVDEVGFPAGDGAGTSRAMNGWVIVVVCLILSSNHEVAVKATTSANVVYQTERRCERERVTVSKYIDGPGLKYICVQIPD